MPEFTVIHLAILASLFAVGIVLGWVLRSDRCAREKIAINAGWQEQTETGQAENERLADQNRNLMRQVSEYQASSNDSDQRTKELAASLQEAVGRRDELQRQIKDVRDQLEAAARERNRLQDDVAGRKARAESEALALKEKDNKIFRLSRQLSSWQTRVPPLVERFQQRDREARELQAELDKATNHIVELEVMTRPDETRIEPVDRDSLGRLDASNDQYGETSEHELSGLHDQVDRYCHPTLIASRTGHSFEDPILSGHDLFPTAVPPDRTSHGARSADGQDDLQQIKGVGPAIERTLNDLGIFRFEQIADISEYDINRIAERLRGFRSRIYREDWIGQARALRQRKDHDPA